MSKSISKADFAFMQIGHGRYRVTYTSPVTFKEWSKELTCMPEIEAVRMYENPKKTDLNELKRLVKS